MKAIFQAAIRSGNVKLADMLRRIDSYHIEGKLTDAERDELYAEARGSAVPGRDADLFAKVVELDAEVKALKELIQAGAGQEPEEVVEKYVTGKWYYNGNKCLWNGKVYTCIAPEGTVCVWSPTDYPAFWSEEV